LSKKLGRPGFVRTRPVGIECASEAGSVEWAASCVTERAPRWDNSALAKSCLAERLAGRRGFINRLSKILHSCRSVTMSRAVTRMWSRSWSGTPLYSRKARVSYFRCRVWCI
jgi:hypothetical protein